MINGDADHSIGRRVVTSSLWLACWRWTARLISFVSIIVLARLLAPEDFGIVATSMLVVALMDILFRLGTDQYLIRLFNPEREDYDTAWTLRIIAMTAAAGAVSLAAIPFANFFGDSRLANVIWVLAFANLLRGFANVGLTIYRRELQFRKLAFMGVGQRVIASVITILLAILFRNYWAMVIGEAAFCVAELILSYLVHPYRPRLSLKRITEQWKFCKWIMFANFADFLQRRADHIVVAKVFGIESVGFYSMARRVAALPTVHLIAPTRLPIYSGLAKKQDKPVEFTRSVLKAIESICILVIPAATLVATLSEPLIISVLGEKWRPAVPLVGPLAFMIVTIILSELATTTLTLSGRVRLIAILQWVSGILVISVMLVVAQFGNLVNLAQSRTAFGVVLLIIYFAWARPELSVSWLRLLKCIYRPGTASLVMGVVISSIVSSSYNPWVTIILATLAGIVTYVASIYVLWRIASPPLSGEAFLVRQCSLLFGGKFQHILKRVRGG